MADQPSWDDIFSSPQAKTPPQPGPAAPDTSREFGAEQFGGPAPADEPVSRRQLRDHESGRPRERRRRGRGGSGGTPRPKRRFTFLWVFLIFVIIVGVGATAFYNHYGSQIRSALGIYDTVDYTGDGAGKVVITIKDGQIGADVAKTLQASGVVKTSQVFYALLVKQTPPVAFHPGSYQLKSQMSAKSALTALEDPKNHVFTRVVLPEGITLKSTIARLASVSQSTGVSEAQLKAAAADHTSYGLPAEAPSLEGYVFPATYSINPGETAHQIFQTFVTTMFKHLDADGVAVADRHKVLTLAALTQKEGGSDADFLKVARVWDNRIAKKMNLQSDATVSYGAGTTSIATTPAQRADKTNKYNTYANPGPPIGPISNPGDAAIKATLQPAVGPWIYFVVVNCSTHETVFSTTLAEQNTANAQLGAWLKANPGGCN